MCGIFHNRTFIKIVVLQKKLETLWEKKSSTLSGIKSVFNVKVKFQLIVCMVRMPHRTDFSNGFNVV